MALRQTHTYADLPVTRETHNEVRKLLGDAGYDHLLDDGRILMQGIALVPANPLAEERQLNNLPLWEGDKP
jgi:hypothetical protein